MQDVIDRRCLDELGRRLIHLEDLGAVRDLGIDCHTEHLLSLLRTDRLHPISPFEPNTTVDLGSLSAMDSIT
ncbi:hypothetical protein ACFWPX_02665 [Nocardia sp. NPDC058518]|uniref:hypothetical protein n=1 Tax=Nocardia sp. NPDC058518 TaxID=3346534 RepID=UPI00364EA282